MIFENCSFWSDHVPASVAEISFAKKQQSRCLLQPDWMHSLALLNQRGVTVWLWLSFQNVTVLEIRSNGEINNIKQRALFQTSNKQFRQFNGGAFQWTSIENRHKISYCHKLIGTWCGHGQPWILDETKVLKKQKSF